MDEMTNTEVGSESSVIAPIDAIPKERVTELVRKEKEAAYRKAQREYQQELEQMRTGQSQQMGGVQPNNEELINRAVQAKIEELERRYEEANHEERQNQYKAYVNEQARTYLEKMDKSGDLADDFKEMTARFKPDRFKEVFFLANSYENTPAIIYELGKNPNKLAQINAMAKSDPELAKLMMDDLSKSIETNQKAVENAISAEPPIGRPKPSIAAGSDSGAMSLRDLKKASWLKG